MKKIKPSFILILIGVVLCVTSVVLFLWQAHRTDENIRQAENIVNQLNAAIPEKSEWIPDDFSDKRIVSAELEGNDYIGLLTASKYNVCLPVLSDGDTELAGIFPYRYSGASYDDKLIIGGADKKGQLDFLKEIEPNDIIGITDMHGYCRNFAVISVERQWNADEQTLLSDGSELTLFAANYWSGEYIIVRCSIMLLPLCIN